MVATGTPASFTYLYNREGGLSARLLNDAAYQATPALQAGTGYTANALNQYTTVGAAGCRHDALRPSCPPTGILNRLNTL